MRIAVDVLPIRPDGSAGGAAGFAVELIAGIAKVPGIEVLVLCGGWNRDYLQKILPGSVRLIQMEGNRTYTGIAPADRLIHKILHCFHHRNTLKANHANILFCPFGAAVFKEQGIPAVSTILDIQHEFYPQFFDAGELEHRKKFYQNIVNRVERVACISDYTKETFCDTYGFDRSRAETIYIAIQNRFQKKDDSVLERLNITKNSYIVYPANFWEHKNHKLLLNAFSMYAAQHKHAKLVLTGNPLEQKQYYEKLLEQLGIREQVVITGYLSEEELYSILDGAKGLIYPSLFEGFGIPVVEAMHLHKLIACSNLTSLPEIGCRSIHYFNPKKPDEVCGGIAYLYAAEMTDEIRLDYDKKLKAYETGHMASAYVKLFQETVKDQSAYVFQEGCSGIYQDGWSGGQVELFVKGKKGCTLEIQGTYPAFAGKKARIVYRENAYRKKYTVLADRKFMIRETIQQDHASISFTIAKTWTPSAKLKNEDNRRLGVMVHGLIVEKADGTRISLETSADS
ncbi:MAG: glycosyltransferase family 4 protein [Eubacterium sp.]|nr:glycosyltransferase family 4 protein [Eubacterium sp.]